MESEVTITLGYTDGMQIKIDDYSITVPSGGLAQRTDFSTVFILSGKMEIWQ